MDDLELARESSTISGATEQKAGQQSDPTVRFADENTSSDEATPLQSDMPRFISDYHQTLFIFFQLHELGIDFPEKAFLAEYPLTPDEVAKEIADVDEDEVKDELDIGTNGYVALRDSLSLNKAEGRTIGCNVVYSINEILERNKVGIIARLQTRGYFQHDNDGSVAEDASGKSKDFIDQLYKEGVLIGKDEQSYQQALIEWNNKLDDVWSLFHDALEHCVNSTIEFEGAEKPRRRYFHDNLWNFWKANTMRLLDFTDDELQYQVSHIAAQLECQWNIATLEAEILRLDNALKQHDVDTNEEASAAVVKALNCIASLEERTSSLVTKFQVYDFRMPDPFDNYLALQAYIVNLENNGLYPEHMRNIKATLEKLFHRRCEKLEERVTNTFYRQTLVPEATGVLEQAKYLGQTKHLRLGTKSCGVEVKWPREPRVKTSELALLTGLVQETHRLLECPNLTDAKESYCSLVNAIPQENKWRKLRSRAKRLAAVAAIAGYITLCVFVPVAVFPLVCIGFGTALSSAIGYNQGHKQGKRASHTIGECSQRFFEKQKSPASSQSQRAGLAREGNPRGSV